MNYLLYSDLEKGQGEGTDAPALDEPDDEQDDEAADRAGTSDGQDRTDQTGMYCHHSYKN